jgi:GT2 family glycosyltransferase
MRQNHFNRWRGTTRHRGEGQPDGVEFHEDCYTDYAPTCFMLIRRVVFERIGLMDEKYFVYYDDTDFVWRANQAEFRLKYWAGGEIWHKVSSSTGGGESIFSIYYGTRNRIYFLRTQMLIWYKFVALTYTLITRLFKLFRYNVKQRETIWRGVKDGV